jgi:hypothetical protein
MGIRDAEAAPSPKSLRARYGTLKPIVQAVINQPAPKKWANATSRTIPNTLLIAVREAICLKPFIILDSR